MRAPSRLLPMTRSCGVGLAFVTALVSGTAIFVSSYAVRRFPGPTVFTTAKNLIAAILLGTLLAATTARRSPAGFTPPTAAAERLGLGVVGVAGGGIAFVLFFEGMSRTSSIDAAFIHKTLVVWVAIGAVAFLHERLGPLHLLAIAALLLGEAVLTEDLGSLVAESGELMILCATLLWSIEVLVAKRLLRTLSPLTVGTARIGIGMVVLLGWLASSGEVADLTGLSITQWGWALLTGTFLTAYVLTWCAALARAQAVDVTAVLVVGAVVTALLDTALKGAPLLPDLGGLALIAAGAALVRSAAHSGTGDPITR